jgi:hypothetical protein
VIVLALSAVGWSVLAGLLGWAVLTAPRPSVPLALICGATGWTVSFAADELVGIHALHPFRPESLLPATAIALAILLTVRRRHGRRRTIFY